MKNPKFWKCNAKLALLLILPLAGGCLQQASSSPEETAAVAKTDSQSAAFAPPATELEPASAEQPSGEDISDAPVKTISSETPAPPPNIRPTGATAEVIKLAESGVDENVMLTFVGNSTAAFSLSAEEIIYLNDIGVPGKVVAAMIQRDHMLKGAYTEPETPPRDVVAGASDAVPTYSAPPGVTETAPPQDYVGETYALPPQPAVATEATFYGSLAPYGTWLDVEGYGRCWQPTAVVANSDWRPYVDRGRWVYSDCGWYWLSDYSWGWAPFHYGRWFRHSRMGWCWSPDTVWGPSWVSWRYSDDHCGWAPLPPRACYRPGSGFFCNGRSVGFSFDFGIGSACYTFVPFSHFRDRHLRQCALPHDEVRRIYARTVVSNRIIARHNTIVNEGIAPGRVAAATHTEVRRVAIHDASAHTPRAGRAERLESNGNTLAVFRPHLSDPARGSVAGIGRPQTTVHRDNGSNLSVPVQPSRPSPASRNVEENTRTLPRWTQHTAPTDTHPTARGREIAPPVASSHSRSAITSVNSDTAARHSTPVVIVPQRGTARNAETRLQAGTAQSLDARSRSSQSAPVIIRWPDRSLPAADDAARLSQRNPQQNAFSHDYGNQNAARVTSVAPRVQAPSPWPATAPEVNQRNSRFDRQPPVTQREPPASSASAPTPWHNSAPAYTPPQRSYSAPAMESHPVHSAPVMESRSSPPASRSEPAARGSPSADRHPR